MRRSKRGIVLIVILGVLTILALLATSFATLQTIERKITANYTDEVRARLVAQSGIDSAIARLNRIVQDGWFSSTRPDRSWVYYGSQLDESLSPDAATPLGGARNPSFALSRDPADADSPPIQIAIEGRTVGISGVVGGTYTRNGDLFALKILDSQSMININDGEKWGPNHSVSRNLRRILNVLGEQPGLATWKSSPSDKLGDLILINRPPGGYATKLELKRFLGKGYDSIAHLITTHSWRNPNVAEPVPLCTQELPAYPAEVSYARPLANGNPIYRYGHGRNFAGDLISAPLQFHSRLLPDDIDYQPFYCAIWSLDSLHPQWIEMVERSPVNINTAPVELLAALITDLEGFFLTSRRRNSPYDIFYFWMDHRYSYDAGWDDRETGGLRAVGRHLKSADELGFLYRTVPFGGPGSRWPSTTPDLIPARLVAEEIAHCRRREISPATGQNYATLPWGGPFTSWAQFNAFVESLVAPNGLIWDRRPVYIDYIGNCNTSYVQQWHGSQAAADVLKANFNPNLHLNELNPDRVLHLRVDKTDLVVHSTEFCFVPMGTFEIQSQGYILANTTRESTVVTGSLGTIETENNRAIAQKTVHASVRLYDALHHTAQCDFYSGAFGPRLTGSVTTNNNRSVESGPEPDNGPAPVECRYDGYLQLPTRLGSYSTGTKPKGTLVTTFQGSGQYPGVARAPAESQEFGESIHAHFQLDHVAGYHVAGSSAALPIGVYPNPGERSLNFPDRTETRRGPYAPPDSVYAATPHRYRLGNHFTLAPGAGAPALFEYARSDLRLDGIYAEVHSAVGYSLQNSRFANNAVIGFWYKPSFRPEMTGRIRTPLSIANYSEHDLMLSIAPAKADSYPFPFSLHLMPVWHSSEEPHIPLYSGTARRTSFLWAVGYGGYSPDPAFDPGAGGFAATSVTLNHEFEPAFSAPETNDRFSGTADGKWNYLRGHEWCHVVVSVEAGGGVAVPIPESAVAPRLKIYVNSELVGGTGVRPDISVHTLDMAADLSMVHGHSVRLGGELSEAAAVIPRQYFADGTIDEFYMWIDQGLANESRANDIYRLGRYYKPADSNLQDALFTSADLSLGALRREVAPAGAIVSPPGGETGVPLPAPTAPPAELLAVAWTCYAEDYTMGFHDDVTPRLKPIMWDYSTAGARKSPRSPSRDADANGYRYESVCDVGVRVGARSFGRYRNEGWSPVRAPILPGETVGYEAKFRVGSFGASSILLASPILDDVTLFYSRGSTEFLEYMEVVP